MPKKYEIVLADPPWAFNNVNTGGSMTSGAANQYPVLSVNDIVKLPVKDIVADDAILFMWWVASQPKEALAVVEGWGFKLKTMTGFVWVKMTKTGLPHFGMGYWTRCLNPDAKVFALNSRTMRVEHVELASLQSSRNLYSHVWSPHGWRRLLAVRTSTPPVQYRIVLPQTEFTSSSEHVWLVKAPYTPRKCNYRLGDARRHLHKLQWCETERIACRRASLSTNASAPTTFVYSNVPVVPPVPVPRIGGLDLNMDLLWLAGLYVAEGSGASPSRIRFSLGAEEVEYQDRICRIVQELGLYSERYKSRRVRAAVYFSRKARSASVELTSRTLWNFIHEFCIGRTAREKRINVDLLLNIMPQLRHAFLQGILDGDGVHTPRFGFSGVRRIGLASSGLIGDLRVLCESLGIPTGKLTARTTHSKLCGDTSVYIMPFTTYGHGAVSFDGATCQTVGAKCISDEPVLRELIDLEIEGGYFVVNGFVTHNSGSENCLIATRGRPSKESSSVRSVVLDTDFENFTKDDGSPNTNLLVDIVRKHSEKPPAIHDRIVSLCGDKPRIELFARRAVAGWDVFGDQLPKESQVNLFESPRNSTDITVDS